MIDSNFTVFKVSDIAIRMADAPFGSNLKNSDYTLFGCLVIQGKNIRGRTCVWDDVRFISKEKYNSLDRSQAKIGDLIFPKVGTIGKVGILTPMKDVSEYVLSTNTMLVEVDCKKANPEYVYYFFSSRKVKDYIESVNPNSVQPVFNFTSLRNFQIFLPSLFDQDKVAFILSSLDDKIDLLHRQNKTLEEMAETLFRQWFVEEAEDDWPTVTFGEKVGIYRGLSYKGSGLTDKSDLLALPMINLNSVYEGGGFKESGTKYYKGEYRDRHLVYPGDVVITNTEQGHEHRLIGFSTIVPRYLNDKCIFSQHIYRLVPKDHSIGKQFLSYLLNYSPLREQVIGATNGSTVNMLSADGLERCVFKLPPDQIIGKFEELASSLQEKKEANILEIRNLEGSREMLLPKLMSGEITVA